LLLSPFGFIGFAQATWITVKYGRPAGEVRSPAATFQTNPGDHPRLVWLIFDEMDERIAFTERPASLQLKELDRLRAEATIATNAFPPAGHTSQSIPALLTGKLISAVKPVSPGELLLTIPAEDVTTGWSTQPNVFSDARALGLNTALAGWYHPYCRVIGDSLTKCNWEAASQRVDTSRLSFTTTLLRQETSLLGLIPMPSSWRPKHFEKSLETDRAGQLADYIDLLKQAESVASDTQFGLTFIHLPVPHPPDIYNREEGRFDNSGEDSYLDNMALADRTLGEIRKTMEAARVWDSTTVVLSSDHWWRVDYWGDKTFWSAENASVSTPRVDHRVPFLIKLAGQKEASTYSAPFNTVLTHDLILDVLSGKISTSSQVHAWLDAHRTIGESPYQTYEDAE
jgi:arylsulfatase A-like enzyme